MFRYHAGETRSACHQRTTGRERGSSHPGAVNHHRRHTARVRSLPGTFPSLADNLPSLADNRVLVADIPVLAADTDIVSGDSPVLVADNLPARPDNRVLVADTPVLAADTDIVSADSRVLAADNAVLRPDNRPAPQKSLKMLVNQHNSLFEWLDGNDDLHGFEADVRHCNDQLLRRLSLLLQAESPAKSA